MAFGFQSIAPYLGAVGNELVNLDEDIEGADDYAGQVLIYVAEVGAAIQAGEDIPEIPELISKGITGKINAGLKATLRIASAALTIAQFQVSGKAATVLKYLNQVLRALIAGRPVPPTPAGIIGVSKIRPLSVLESRLTQIESQISSLQKTPATP